MKNKQLVIERSFNAAIEKVWEAFTTPEILAKWWAPAGMSNAFATTDVREGGEFRYCFKSDDGKEYWGRGIYQTITQPTFFSYLDDFTDAEGQPVPPSHYGMPGDELATSLIEITLKPDGTKTHMNITMASPHINDEMTDEMVKGWNSMFDKLRDNLK